jgi:hypothetical protein
VAALLLEATPLLTPGQIYATLEGSTIDMGPPGFDVDSGFGLIQADVALATATTTTTTTTTIPMPCATVGCDDGNPCTDDVCDPATGCQHASNTSPCSDGMECTLADRCSGGQCQPGPSVTAGTLSTLVTGGVNASLAECGRDKRKKLKQVVNPLVQAAKAFSRAEAAGVGTKKWTKQVRKGEKKVSRARSKLTKVQAKLSPPCVGQLENTLMMGALGDVCL